VGYVKAAFEPAAEQAEGAKEEPAKLPKKRKSVKEQKKAARGGAGAAEARQTIFGCGGLRSCERWAWKLVPVELPKFPYSAIFETMLTAESAAGVRRFDAFGTRQLLTAQKDYDWPNTFRSARFIPAVEYIQAARARTMLMEEMAKVLRY